MCWCEALGFVFYMLLSTRDSFLDKISYVTQANVSYLAKLDGLSSLHLFLARQKYYG